MKIPRTVFVAGATGYIGQRLCARLLQHGHTVIALARAGSQHKLPAACRVVLGDALNAASYAPHVPAGCIFVHLVGVAHPSPTKAQQFIDVDLASVRASLSAAQQAAHFVYISVAQPAPVMLAFVAARQAAEQLIRQRGINASILRPWYVLGPGHRWPLLLWPLYWLGERLPRTRETTQRLGLVSLVQMLKALTAVIEQAAPGHRIYDVQAIRSA